MSALFLSNISFIYHTFSMVSLVLIKHTTKFYFFIIKKADGFDLINSTTDCGNIFRFPAQVFYVEKQGKIWNCQDEHVKECVAWQMQLERDSLKSLPRNGRDSNEPVALCSYAYFHLSSDPIFVIKTSPWLQPKTLNFCSLIYVILMLFFVVFLFMSALHKTWKKHFKFAVFSLIPTA